MCPSVPLFLGRTNQVDNGRRGTVVMDVDDGKSVLLQKIVLLVKIEERLCQKAHADLFRIERVTRRGKKEGKTKPFI